MSISVVGGFEKIVRFLLPSELSKRPEGFEERQLKASVHRSSVRDLLMYRYYTEDNGIGPEGYNGGFYTMADGRRGVIFRISPPPYMTPGSEGIINSLLSQVYYDGISMHVITHASKNINTYIKNYKKIHHCKVNVKHPEVLQAMVNERAAAMDKWRTESMSSISDFRMRTFNNLISFSFPIELNMNAIIQQVNSYIGVLSDFHPQNLHPDELLSITKEILQPDAESWDSHIDIHQKMNVQMSKDARIRATIDDDFFRIGENTYARTMMTEKFPKVLKTLELQSAFMDPFGRELTSAIPGTFLCSLNVVFSETEKRRKQALSKMRWDVGMLGGVPMKTKKKYPHLKEKYVEATNTIEYITENGEVPLESMWSLILFEDSQEALDNLTARVKKRFEDVEGMWKLKTVQQQSIAYQSMMMSLPLQYLEIYKKHMRRHDLLFKSNNAQVAPLLGDMKGYGLPYMTYTGRAGQVIPIDPLSQNANYNFMVIGPMGSGKSVFTNDMATQLLTSGFRLIGMDIGRSYLPAISSIGGQYVEFTDEADLCFNFFTNVRTKIVDKYDNEQGSNVKIEQIHEDELSNIIPLVGIMMGTNLSSSAKDESIDNVNNDLDRKMLAVTVERAVQMAYKRKRKAAGMSTVYESLTMIYEQFRNDNVGEKTLTLIHQAITGLEDFALDTGKYYRYFNGSNNINFESDYFLMELEELKSTKLELLPVIQFAMLQRIAQEAFLDDDRPMFVFFDEARFAMSNKIFAAALVDFATRFRKYKKFLAVISQATDDFFMNTQSKIMFEQSSYKVFLKTNTALITSAVRGGRLELNAFEREQMSNIRNHAPNYNEACIRFDENNIITTLKLTKLELYLYSTKPSDKDRRKALIRNYGFSYLETAYFMMIEDEGRFNSLDDIVEEMRRRMESVGNEDKLKEMWIGRISRAISERSFTLYLQPIFRFEEDKKTNSVSSYEAQVRISTTDGDVPAIQFMDIAKENGLYGKALRAIALQAFELFSVYRGVRFSLNVTMSDILDDGIRKFLISEALNYGVSDRLTFDVSSRHLVQGEVELLDKAAKELSEVNIYLALDNVKQSTLDMTAVLSVKPNIIKVDGSVIRQIEESGDAKMFLELIAKGFSSVGVKVSAAHVASKQIMELCQGLGINHLQGIYLQEPRPAEDVLNSLIEHAAEEEKKYA